jgi:hypothetical protein
MNEQWSQQMFDEQLHTEFEISDGLGRRINVELVEVTQHENRQLETLSLLFHGPAEPILAQDTLRVRHSALGEMQIFMGPINRPLMEGTFYEAVFNRLKEQESL